MPRPNRGAQLKFIRERQAYYIQWYEQGRPRKRSTGTADLGEAEERLAQFISDRNAQRRAKSGPRDPSQVPVTEVLTVYMEQHAPTAADPARIAYAIQALLPFWEGNMVGEVTKEACRSYQRNRDRAVSTVRRELTTLRAAINFAYGEGVLTRPQPVWLPAAPAGKDRFLTRPEVAALLNAARTGRSDVRLYLPLFIVLAIYTGARKEAILSLRWSQVDFAKRRINFRRFDDDGNPLAETSKKRAHIPIPNRLMTFLQLAHRRRSSDIGPVIHDKGAPIIDVGDSAHGSFGGACKRAGLTKVTPHTLRHTCGTWMAQRGVSLFNIGQWLGHSDERTTKLYAHHHPDFQGEALDAMNRRN